MPEDPAAGLERAVRRARRLATHDETWGEPGIPLRITSYAADELPPLADVTSVRCIVLHGRNVLVQQEPHSTHVSPGGRREPGEDLGTTLDREIREETGCRLASPALLGFTVLHHLGPRPAGYRYPYPDFVQAMYVAELDASAPREATTDGSVIASIFRPLAEVRTLPLTEGQRAFLRLALWRTGRAPDPDLDRD